MRFKTSGDSFAGVSRVDISRHSTLFQRYEAGMRRCHIVSISNISIGTKLFERMLAGEVIAHYGRQLRARRFH